jgi:dTDP-4-dehydrorhamnose reductase
MHDSRHPKPDSEKLLVIGVDGIVGANLALSLADRFEVVGLFHTRPVSLPGCRTAPWDPAHPEPWISLIHRQRPQWIVHCGPLASNSWDVPQPCPDGTCEARVCQLLAESSQEVGSRLTVISSDAVFAGPRLFHQEGSTATSRQPFAGAIRQAEKGLEGTHALLVRTHAYGWGPPGTTPGFAERVWQSLVEGRAARFDPDRHATPMLASRLAELLWLAYRRGLEGTYHLAGAERASAYHFAMELAAAFGLRSGDPLTEDDSPGRADADHLHETSLNTRKARRELGCAMPMLREGLDRFAQQAASGYRARLQCSVPEAAAAGAA